MKLTFVDVGVEGKLVLVSKESCDLDALQIGVKLTFLNGAFWLSQHDALALFCSEGFFGPQTNEIALQFRKERKCCLSKYFAPLIGKISLYLHT